MTITLIDSSRYGRARNRTTFTTTFATTFEMAAPATTTTTDGNPWLDGTVRGSGSCPTHAIKRIAPGSLGGMT